MQNEEWGVNIKLIIAWTFFCFCFFPEKGTSDGTFFLLPPFDHGLEQMWNNLCSDVNYCFHDMKYNENEINENQPAISSGLCNKAFVHNSGQGFDSWDTQSNSLYHRLW